MCTKGEEVMASLDAALDALDGQDAEALPTELIREQLTGLLRAVNRLHAQLARRVAVFDARGACVADAARTTRAWLRMAGRMSPPAASRLVTAARLMRELPVLAEGAAHGEVSAEHVERIARLAERVTPDVVSAVERPLAELARRVDPGTLDKACHRVRQHVDPDGPRPDPNIDFNRRSITLSCFDGMLLVRGQLDPEGGAALQTALDALMRPPGPADDRTAGQRRADAMVELARGALRAGRLPEVGGARPQVAVLLAPPNLAPPHLALQSAPKPAVESRRTSMPQPVPRPGRPPGPAPGARPLPGHGSRREDRPPGRPPTPESTPRSTPRSPARLRESSLAGWGSGSDAVNLASGQGAGSGQGTGSAQVSGTAGSAQPGRAGTPAGDPLTAAGIAPAPPTAWLEWVGDIPDETAQRIACDADVWAVVRDQANGRPLQLGRTHRVVPGWLRKALHARDRGCRFPGCDAPSAWTDAHHIQPWARGGTTDVDNLLLLCRWHHGRVHEGGWSVSYDPATGKVAATRPGGSPFVPPGRETAP